MNRPLGASRLGKSRKPGPAPFVCMLDESSLELLPRPAIAKLKGTSTRGDLVLNPYCYLGPAELYSGPLAGGFAAREDIAWILDPERNALQPFWLRPEVRGRLANVQAGGTVTSDLLPQERRLLRFAGVLINEREHERHRQERVRRLAHATAFFRENRYVALSDLLHPLHIAALRRHIRQLTATGMLVKGRGGYKHCHLRHNEPVARFFHHQLTSVVSDVIGEPVQPSFAFTLSYHEGAELSRHTDRDQCEFTLSLCVDFIPEPEGVTSWPLHIETDRGRVTLEQALGDAVLFCGRELTHYRDRLAEGCTSTSLLFHFVRRNFDGDLD